MSFCVRYIPIWLLIAFFGIGRGIIKQNLEGNDVMSSNCLKLVVAMKTCSKTNLTS